MSRQYRVERDENFVSERVTDESELRTVSAILEGSGRNPYSAFDAIEEMLIHVHTIDEGASNAWAVWIRLVTSKYRRFALHSFSNLSPPRHEPIPPLDIVKQAYGNVIDDRLF